MYVYIYCAYIMQWYAYVHIYANIYIYVLLHCQWTHLLLCVYTYINCEQLYSVGTSLDYLMYHVSHVSLAILGSIHVRALYVKFNIKLYVPALSIHLYIYIRSSYVAMYVYSIKYATPSNIPYTYIPLNLKRTEWLSI